MGKITDEQCSTDKIQSIRERLEEAIARANSDLYHRRYPSQDVDHKELDQDPTDKMDASVERLVNIYTWLYDNFDEASEDTRVSVLDKFYKQVDTVNAYDNLSAVRVLQNVCTTKPTDLEDVFGSYGVVISGQGQIRLKITEAYDRLIS